jgi:ketosteroid isomerase-like protein
VTSNLELVRSIFSDWERGDYRSTEWAHPEIEFVLVGDLDAGSWTGIDAMGEAWRRWLSSWEEFHTEAEEYRELEGDRVLVLTRNTGRGRMSGVELGQMPTPGATVFDVRDGKVTRIAAYTDAERALADLGPATGEDPTPRSRAT